MFSGVEEGWSKDSHASSLMSSGWRLERFGHRTISLLRHALFLRKWRQTWIFIKHTKVNKKGVFDHSFIPETIIYLAYCCKFIKNDSNAFFLSQYKPELVLYQCSRWRGEISYVNIMGWYYNIDSVRKQDVWLVIEKHNNIILQCSPVAIFFKQRMCKKVDSVKVGWRNNDGAIEHRFIAILSSHLVIVITPSRHRFIDPKTMVR